MVVVGPMVDGAIDDRNQGKVLDPFFLFLEAFFSSPPETKTRELFSPPKTENHFVLRVLQSLSRRRSAPITHLRESCSRAPSAALPGRDAAAARPSRRRGRGRPAIGHVAATSPAELLDENQEASERCLHCHCCSCRRRRPAGAANGPPAPGTQVGRRVLAARHGGRAPYFARGRGGGGFAAFADAVAIFDAAGRRRRKQRPRCSSSSRAQAQGRELLRQRRHRRAHHPRGPSGAVPEGHGL